MVFAVGIFYFSKPNAKENNIASVNSGINGDTTFRIGAFWTGSVISKYDSLKEMNINLWHCGSGIDNGWTGVNVLNDYRNSNYSQYGQNVKNRIDSNYTYGNLRTIMDRSKINYLGYGKRSDYECETNVNSNYWFYAYRDHNPNVSDNILDNSQFGSNNTYVRYSQKNVHDTGYVVKRLISNREQTSFSPGINLKWYIMPRIRINPEDTTTNKLVCKIEILRYDSILIKSININTTNFRDGTHPYDGRYLETFYNLSELLEIDSTGVFNPDHKSYNNDTCGVDIKVRWAGQCDMWLDRIRVENEIAYDLFGDNPIKVNYNKYQDWLTWEAQNIAGSEQGKVHYFLIDEPEFCQLPVLSYLNNTIIQLSGGASSLVPVFSIDNFKAHLPNFFNTDFNTGQLKTYLIDSAGFQMYSFDCYPLFGWVGYCYLPNTLPYVTNYNEVTGQLGRPVPPTEYENWFQDYFDGTTPFWGGARFIKTIKSGYELYKQYNIPFSASLQSHLNFAGDGQLREPTNEEIAMMTNVAVSYGAKEIMYFVYGGYGELPAPTGTTPNYCRGIADWKASGLSKRDTNVYHQNKWEGVKAVTTKLKKWGPKLMKFSNTNTNSYIYHDGTDRTLLSGNSCFSKFVTLRQGNDANECVEDNMSGMKADCQYSTYLQVSTFGGIEPNSNYFMVVNRRCSPYVNDNSIDNIGGHRQVRAFLHSNYSAFSDFNNWSVVNCENDSVVASFNKSNPGYVNLDWFMPGEGRLFKIVPMMSTGGILQTDESFNSDVICRKNIYNNGFNITIGTNANVSFADSVVIYMSGGNLTIGSINDNPTSGHLQFKGITSNNKWQGFVLDSCGVVQVYGGYFNNIMQNQSAFNVSNCFHYRFENNQFTCAQGENSNGININYNLTSFEDEIENAYHYIRNNNFNFTGNSNYAINITATGSASIPVLIESNTLNTNYGIFVENISGGAINQNSISNYTDGITLLSSNCDFYQNTLTSSETDATGIKLLLSTSVISPTSSNGYFVGGLNNLSSIGSNSSNIKVEDSYFNIDNGYNVFDIDFENSPRHITGYFPYSSESEYKAGYNCFKNNSVIDTASIYVTQGSGEEASRITFNTDPTYCGSQEFANYEVFNLAGNINDTVYYRSGGTGGGYKDGQAMAIETQTTYKLLKDSISLNLRKHFYNLTELECREMLLNYPDSSESIGMVSKLYLSSLTLDSAGNHIQITKTFFENLILNNPNNTPLIKRANYFVQKCKVALKQYTSALQGFQEIINQNPYSYEGLIASWDYAATQLLANSGGSFSDEEVKSNEEESEIISYNINYLLDSLKNKKSTTTSYSTENYDTKKFTKQDRESINSNVTNAFKNERTKQIEKIQELEKKITSLSNNNSKTKPKTKNDELVLSNAKKELKTMKTLSEVVKVKKPKNINEHNKNINADIKKYLRLKKHRVQVKLITLSL